jgi:hypothetical protein
VLRRIQMMHVLYRRPAAARGIEGVDGESTPIHDAAMIVICLPNPPSALTPGPVGLMSRLLPIMVNAPPASKFGGPNPSVPVNGWPSLQVATIVATVVPKGVVLAIDGFGGSKDKLITGVCPGAGVKKTSTK